MFNKKIIMLTIIITCLLAVSAVSATDNATSDVVSVDETTDDIINVENDSKEILEENNANETLSFQKEDNLESNFNDEVLTYEYISYAQITTDTVTGYAGDYITLKANVKNDQGIAKKATVEFRFNGETYTTTTDYNGDASVTVKCPSTEVWDTSSKTKGNIITKTTIYKKYYYCDVTAYGTDYYKNTDSFYVISKKSTLIKKYKIIKKKITKTIKIKNGMNTYKWGKYAAATYKHKGGYGTVIETAMGKKDSGYIKFFIKYHYKKNGKWKWGKWNKIPKDYYDEYTYGKHIKCDKLKVRYTQVTYKQI